MVVVRELRKVYEPSPWWMRVLVRTPIQEPLVALDEVSFEVWPGQICAVIGPNGAGKSTLFRVLTGLTTPTSGSAFVMGLNAESEAHKVRRVVGFMPSEDRTLYLRHTCEENLVFHGRLQGLSGKTLQRRIREVLELVGLIEARERAGFALSSGMRARLLLARAILHEPAVLILDEPTGAVDPVGAFDLLEIIQKITVERGLATLVSSHRVEEIEALRDNVMLLDRGQVVYWGDLETVRRMWDRPRYEISFADEEALDKAAHTLKRAEGIELLSAGDSTLNIVWDQGVGELFRCLDSQLASIQSLTESRMPLSELLRSVLAEGPANPMEPG